MVDKRANMYKRVDRAYHALSTVELGEVVELSRKRNLDPEVESGVVDLACVFMVEKGINATYAVNLAALRMTKDAASAPNQNLSLDAILEDLGGVEPRTAFHSGVKFAKPDSCTETTVKDVVADVLGKLGQDHPSAHKVCQTVLDHPETGKHVESGQTVSFRALARCLDVPRRDVPDLVENAQVLASQALADVLAEHASEAGTAKRQWTQNEIDRANRAFYAMQPIAIKGATVGFWPMPPSRTYASKVATRNKEDIRSARAEDWFSRLPQSFELFDGKMLKS